MSKVTFEYDLEENTDDINFITNMHKIRSALYDLQKFRRDLYKGYYSESDNCNCLMQEVEVKNAFGDLYKSIRPVKIVTEEDIEEARAQGKRYVEDTKTFIKCEYVEDTLDTILRDINFLLD